MTLSRSLRFSPRRSTHRGFTLIELMITVAIVGILARVALPAYLDYAKRGKLTEAFNQLSSTALALGQYYQDNRTYVGFASCGGSTTNFTYDCSTVSATGYTMRAVGANSLAGFTFTLTETGARATTAAPSGWPTSANCWTSSRSGACQ